MKTVFSSNSQLSHVWAQQKQVSGKTKNMFFSGTKIYSYGMHYLAAEIHVKGKNKLALINSHRYSNTTSKHLSDIRSALRDIVPCVETKTPGDLKLARAELDEIAKNGINEVLKRSKITSQDEIESAMQYGLMYNYVEANRLRTFLGMKGIVPKKSDIAKARKHLEKRLARYKELNTPEMIEKKRIETEKRAKKQELKKLEALQESVNKFRLGERVNLSELSYDLLRVQGDSVVTSRGAQVPLNSAIALLKRIKQGGKIRGEIVGDFTAESILAVESDKIVKIGCHKIKLSEAESVLGVYIAKFPEFSYTKGAL